MTRVRMKKEEVLEKVGLKHNPCQGCEAYYTRDGLLTGCAVEADGGCQWVVAHDRALAAMPPMDELRRLEREIAYHAARSDIECMCQGEMVGQQSRLWLYDITSAESEEETEWVAMAVRYLELRGLLLRDPENPVKVRPLDDERNDQSDVHLIKGRD